MKAYIVHFKSSRKDPFGFEKVVWLTRSQVDMIIKLRNDKKERDDFIKVGSYIFAPMEISIIEETQREKIDAPKYFRDRYALEILEAGHDSPELEAGKGIAKL